MFLGPLLHRSRRLRAALRRRLQPRHPHRRAAHGRAAPVRPRGQGDRRQLPRQRQPGDRARPADRAHRARRHRHRERPDGGGAAPRHHRHPQRLVELHGPGPLLLPAAARRRRRGHRHHHADGHRRRPRSTSTSTTRPARTRSRRCRCSPPRSSPSPQITIQRVPIEFLEIELATAGGDGLPVLPLRGVRRPQRPHPPGRHHHPAERAARAARQDPPDAVPGPQHRQPAVLRGHRRGRRGPDAAARLGLREPRDLPHRAQQARRRRSSCSTRTG